MMENMENTESADVTNDARMPAPKKPAKRGRGRPRKVMTPRAEAKAITETPEFRKALQDAVSEVTRELVEKLANARSDAGTDAAPSADAALIKSLATTLFEMSDQGTNRAPRVDPDELAARQAARAKMEDVLIQAAAEGRVVSYQLTRTVFLDEQIVEPTRRDPQSKALCTQDVDWIGVPDESMVPLNETAREVHALFMRSIGGKTKEAKVPFKHARDNPRLRIHGQEQSQPVRDVAAPLASGGLRVHNPGAQGQIKDVRVLGTLSEPARQLAA
jgi:hypothetical protein